MPGVARFNEYCVYRHTSTISNKSYIGYTVSGIMKRWYSHIRDVNQGSKTHFCNAIRKYGKKSWIHEVLYKTDNKEDAQQKEIELIEKYDTFNSGYNLTKGGDGGCLEIFGGSYWMKNKTQEEIDIINDKKAMYGKDNPFYGKKHTVKSLNQMVDKRRKNGSYISSASAIKVKYDGKIYESKKECQRQCNMTRHKFDKLVKEGIIKEMKKETI